MWLFCIRTQWNSTGFWDHFYTVRLDLMWPARIDGCFSRVFLENVSCGHRYRDKGTQTVHSFPNIVIHTRTLTQTDTHTHALTHINTHIVTPLHTYTYIHTHIHTSTQWCKGVCHYLHSISIFTNNLYSGFNEYIVILTPRASVIWKSNSKQQLGSKFDIMDYESYFLCFDMQLYMSWYIRSFFGFTFLNILYFFKYSCTNIFL